MEGHPVIKNSHHGASFWVDNCSDVNKDLGFKAKVKAKDLGFKAKVKDLSFKAKAKDLSFKAKAKDLTQVKIQNSNWHLSHPC